MEETVGLTLRMPVALRDWLKRLALKNSRSMNNQIVSILRELEESSKKNAPEGRSSEALKSEDQLAKEN